jgi:hypothetical protein
VRQPRWCGEKKKRTSLFIGEEDIVINHGVKSRYELNGLISQDSDIGEEWGCSPISSEASKQQPASDSGKWKAKIFAQNFFLSLHHFCVDPF